MLNFTDLHQGMRFISNGKAGTIYKIKVWGKIAEIEREKDKVNFMLTSMQVIQSIKELIT